MIPLSGGLKVEVEVRNKLSKEARAMGDLVANEEVEICSLSQNMTL